MLNTSLFCKRKMMSSDSGQWSSGMLMDVFCQPNHFMFILNGAASGFGGCRGSSAGAQPLVLVQMDALLILFFGKLVQRLPESLLPSWTHHSELSSRTTSSTNLPTNANFPRYKYSALPLNFHSPLYHCCLLTLCLPACLISLARGVSSSGLESLYNSPRVHLSPTSGPHPSVDPRWIFPEWSDNSYNNIWLKEN